ncbi:putative hydro-lyase [Fulvimarina sp. MAC3]|uniref:putative hydro-lyase n=1 Tax=Fulvimarina sp. MAC3 TaxID=3148887 RepID=UPI0031FCF881
MATTYETLKTRSAVEVRQVVRAGEYRSHTAGLGIGTLQANVAIMPERAALDFMRFCQRNPKPCPLVGVTDTGDPMMKTLGMSVDIRTDVPAYYVYRNGKLAESLTDISDLWQDDFVAFALGCSFTFENALTRAGIPMWHIENDRTVPMFRSAIDTVPAGPFGGKMVVSMRAIAEDRVKDVMRICARFPYAHGAPVHVGDPAAIGIDDLSKPVWGDSAPLPEGHVPAFWACGVTPQVALEQAGLPVCITHKPGHMLITDVPEDAEHPILSAA